MLISRKLLNLSRDTNLKLQDYYNESREVSKELGIIDRIKLNRLEKLILNLSSKLAIDSGWTYTPGEFILKSGYHYDIKYQEIGFDINKVEVGKPLTEESTKYERDFQTKYGELLNRLNSLLKRRESIIKPHTNKSSNVIDLKRTIEDRNWNKDILRDLDYINYITSNFVNENGADGIKRLIDLLNLLTDSDDDLLTIFNSQIRNGITYQYARELYFWASSFSPKAGYTIDLLERQREENEKAISPELRELIR